MDTPDQCGKCGGKTEYTDWLSYCTSCHGRDPIKRIEELQEMLRQVACSGVELEDERMSYTVIQIDADLWRELKKLRPEQKITPVCVQHKDGWCATRLKTGKYRDNVKTLCDHYVTLPLAVDRRQPTCPQCLALLAK